MKTLINLHKIEHAQMLPIVVIGLIVMIAMAALILDGGALMLNRRSAQNAADAGALAGARVLCKEPTTNQTNIYNAIYKYTTTENHAIIVDRYVTAENVGVIKGLVKGEVVVTSKIEQDSFFAKIFNQNSITSRATAGAGCFPYRPEVVLPIAWSCRPPATGSASEKCDYVKLSWPIVKAVTDTYDEANDISDKLFADHRSEIYIIMASDKICGEEITCDFNLDDPIDRYQLSSGGNRGWLNLTGDSSGTSNLEGWIENGLDDEIKTHTWLTGINGNRKSVYTALKTRLDEVVWIPVYNVLCDQLPSDKPECLIAAHSEDAPGIPLPTGQNDIVIPGAPATPVLHVVGFAPFFITCVRDVPGDTCPGFELAQTKNPTVDFKNNTRSLEGYFVDPDSLDGENVSLSGADLGVYTVSLTR